VVFAGGAVHGRRIYRPIEPTDIAPTLAAIVGAKAPSGAFGGPLQEVLESIEPHPETPAHR
jgi:hypothetical protein